MEISSQKGVINLTVNSPNIQVDIPVRTGDHVFAEMSADLCQFGRSQVLLVADANTFQACGGQVEQAVRSAGLVLNKMVFPAQPVLRANEASIAQVLQALNGQEHLLAAVGSGTITDIVRYVAFQTNMPFISIPTAASVDAYTSFTASITLQQLKRSILAKPPLSVYAHLPVLCTAPQNLTLSGFSDMVAKYTALADWKLSHLLVGEVYHDLVAQRAGKALQECVKKVDEIRSGSTAGITVIVEGLMISGCSMFTVKSSRPAAGAEHSLAHFWEIYHQLNNLPAALHGEKTGVACVLIAKFYEALRCLSPLEAVRRLDHFKLPDPYVEEARLRLVLGPVAAPLLASQPSFLGDLRQQIDLIKSNLVAHWDQVQEVAITVPTSRQIAALLESAGSASKPSQVHVQEQEVQMALENAMYVRDRLTILELNRMLNLVPIS